MKRESDIGRQLRDKTNEEVCQWIAGFNDEKGLGFRLLGHHELQRRLRQPDAMRSWIAIGISVIALLISIFLHVYQ
jgi:hypothetical protein